MAKASPKPSDFVKLAARNLGLIKTGEEALPALEKVWAGQQLPGKGFRDFEAALMRLGKDYCRKARCEKCPLREECRCRRD
jgi:adenine-specific DNA glycosylase